MQAELAKCTGRSNQGLASYLAQGQVTEGLLTQYPVTPRQGAWIQQVSTQSLLTVAHCHWESFLPFDSSVPRDAIVLTDFVVLCHQAQRLCQQLQRSLTDCSVV